MEQWKLNPPAIQTVLRNVGEEGAEFIEAIQKIDLDPQGTSEEVGGFGYVLTTDFSGAAYASPRYSLTDSVVSAVLNAALVENTSTKEITDRIIAGFQGVANATIAYNQGNEDMAAEFQTEAAEAARTGNFAYFDEHGVQA